MLITHSPYFVNPTEDHTTIVRLESSGPEGSVSTRTYKSDNASFEDAGTINKLKALTQIDANVSEMFFGSFPILVGAARSEGLTVNYHVSFPDFESWLEILAVSKDKPPNTYDSVSNNLPLITKGQELFNLLCSGVNADPISQEVLFEHNNDYMSALLQISREEAQ